MPRTQGLDDFHSSWHHHALAAFASVPLPAAALVTPGPTLARSLGLQRRRSGSLRLPVPGCRRRAVVKGGPKSVAGNPGQTVEPQARP